MEIGKFLKLDAYLKFIPSSMFHSISLYLKYSKVSKIFYAKNDLQQNYFPKLFITLLYWKLRQLFSQLLDLLKGFIWQIEQSSGFYKVLFLKNQTRVHQFLNDICQCKWRYVQLLSSFLQNIHEDSLFCNA